MTERENEPFLRVLFVEATGRFARRMYAGDRAAFTVELPGAGWFMGTLAYEDGQWYLEGDDGGGSIRFADGPTLWDEHLAPPPQPQPTSWLHRLWRWFWHG